MASQRGLTLLEMLISLVILSSVMAIASTAYSYYATGFNERQQRFGSRLNQLKKELSWQDQLASAFYYYVETAPNNYRPVFTGDAEELSWMSTSGILQPGTMARSWLGISEGYLTYCEQPVSEKLITSIAYNKTEMCNSFMQRLYPLESVEISYFSWPSMIDRHISWGDELPVQPNRAPRWANSHNSAETEVLPGWVRLTLQAEQAEPYAIWIRIENNDVDRLQIFAGNSNA
tara:strand:- start:1446 stop:2141 length:696 start_codon:yes stop_codon:yes gene_type:complete